MFVEAEAFEVQGTGFKVEDGTLGRNDKQTASGNEVLVADERGDARATYQVELPAGDYRVWLRAAPPPENRAEQVVVLDVSQAGAVRATQRIVPPSSGGPKPTLSYEWFSFEMKLDEGRAELSLSKTSPRAFGKLDCLLLTRDRTYVPDYRHFGVQLFMRVRYEGGDHSALELQSAVSNARLKRGSLLPPTPRGATSDWLNMTKLFSGGADGVFQINGKGEWQQADYTLEFATEPSPKSIVRSIRRNARGAELTVVVPGQRSRLKAPQADFEIAASNAARLKRLPKLTFGRRPTRFAIITDLSKSARLRELEYPVAEYVGVNGLTGLLTPEDIAAGLTVSRIYNSVNYPGEHGFIDMNLAAVERDVARSAELAKASPARDRVRHLKVMDEAQPPSLESLVADPVRQQAFAQWLKDRKVVPFDAGELATLKTKGIDPHKAVRLTADRDDDFPGLYYYSQRFRAFGVTEYFRNVVAHVRAEYPSGIPATQNLSDGAVLAANMYFQGNDYFDYFDKGVLDVALSEDWSNSAVTRELSAWNVALLRAATRRHRQPIHMYVVAYSERAPLEVKLKAMSEVAQGAKLLNFYTYAPSYRVPRPGWADDPIMQVALGEVAREIGAAEDVLVGALPVPAQTAILYSVPGDIWSLKADSSRGFERMFTFLALRHAQLPVDVLSDEQVAEGLLAPYRALYVFDEQVPVRTQRVLSDWVKAGGTLVLGPGAASRDEWNRPRTLLDEQLQLGRGALEPLQSLPTAGRAFIDAIVRQDSVHLEAAKASTFDVLVARQRPAEPAVGKVLARFSDGGPAARELNRGKGRVIVLGFLAGLPYMKVAADAFRSQREQLVAPMNNIARAIAALSPTPLQPANVRLKRAQHSAQLPYAYPAALRSFIVSPALTAGVEQRATCDAAQVETAWLEDAIGWAVPLANYTGTPLARVQLTLAPRRRHGPVQSAHQGDLKVQTLADGREVVELPLESTDVVYARW